MYQINMFFFLPHAGATFTQMYFKLGNLEKPPSLINQRFVFLTVSLRASGYCSVIDLISFPPETSAPSPINM